MRTAKTASPTAAPAAAAEPASAAQKLLIVAALLAGSLFVYAPTARHEFLSYDDGTYVYDNEHVRTGLSVENFLWAFELNGLSQWHPLTWLSHQLDCQLFGVSPRGHHLHNVALHAACSAVLFLALLEMTGALWPSAFVAAVFAVHPLNVESVAWVAERKNVLSALLGLLTVWAYAVYAKRGGFLRYLLMAGLMALGLMAKPMLVTLPCALLLLDVWPLGRCRFLSAKIAPPGDPQCKAEPACPLRSLTRLLLEKVPLLGLSALSALLTIWCLPQTHGVRSLETVSLTTRLAQAVTMYATYVQRLIWPANLSLNSTTGQPATFAEAPWITSAAAIVLVAVTAAALWCIRRRPYLSVGWFWYLGLLLPVSGLFAVGTQMLADRYTYLPLIGVTLAATWLASEWAVARRHGRLWAGAAGCLLLAFALTARGQAAHWKNDIALYRRALAVAPADHLSHINLGDVLNEAGQPEAAIKHFREAVRISPASAVAHRNLASTLHKVGRADEALPHYEAAVRFDPHNAQARINLGCLLQELGQLERAAALLQHAVRLDPDSFRGQYNLGLVRLQQRRLDAAAGHLQKAVALQPHDIDALNNLGITFGMQGRLASAINCFQAALELQPAHRPTRRNLQMAVARQRARRSAFAGSPRDSGIRPISHSDEKK